MKKNDFDKNICIVGLGYVGLPTALAFHESGYTILGIDVSENTINLLNQGKNPLIDATSNQIIPNSSDRWKVSTDFKEIKNSDIILITVPTPVNEDKSPNLSYVVTASTSVLDNIDRNKKTTIVLESTVYPGVTRKVLGKLLQERDIKIGKEVEIAYCPERVSPGDEGRTVGSVARVIGCDDEGEGENLARIYSSITTKSSTYVGKIEVAEAAKMVENLQRDIDIALSNELSIVLSRIGVDVEEVLSAAATKWNFHRHTPGIGVGGHCIPVDPYYYIELANKVGYNSILSKTARDINEGMPRIAASEIMNKIGKNNNMGKIKILILGYSYKPELGDTRETPVKELVEILNKNDFEVILWDPLVNEDEIPDFVNKINDPYCLKEVEMIVLATAHKEILNLDWDLLGTTCTNKRIYDGRRVLDKNKFRNKHWDISGIGIPE